MIFHFQNLETLRLAVSSGLAPAEVCLAPAKISADGQNGLLIEPVNRPTNKAMQNGLKRMGVKIAKSHNGAAEEVSSWLQAFPLVAKPDHRNLDPQTPVLFEMPVNELPHLVNEMMRLGNDRQTVRYLEKTDTGEEKVLLRVIGPPYYTLLRAIDRSANAPQVIVGFVEQAPRFWVEIGYTHPFAAQIQIPEGEMILIRPPRRWTVLADGRFEDIYQILEFPMPHLPVNHQERQLKNKLTVPLRLAPGNAAEIPEMWILTEDGVDILDAFAREANETLLRRLSFAVAENLVGPPTVILRTRPQRVRSMPPTLALEKSLGMKSRRGFENLYLPVGMRLQPTLRKDVLQKLFFSEQEAAQLIWLMPDAQGKFSPQTIAEDAFRPLEDWVDYVIDHDREILQSWMHATQFDFEHFICKADLPEHPSSNAGDPARNRPANPSEPTTTEKRSAPQAKSAAKKEFRPGENAMSAPAESAENSQAREDLGLLEQKFLQNIEALDSKEKLKLWPELAALNTRLRLYDDAALCWLNAIWETPNPPGEWIWQWLRSEDPDASPEPTMEEWDTHLANSAPMLPAMRAFAARILWCAYSAAGSVLLRQRLPEISSYLESHESVLPFRAIWLGWVYLARMSGMDVLGLARVRDRLLNRLLPSKANGSKGGLNRDRDLPRFLRSDGLADRGRMREISERADRLYLAAQKWGEDIELNRPYFDLIFAFGFAQIGDIARARELRHGAIRLLQNIPGEDGKPDFIHDFLAQAFDFRIEQALTGQEHQGPLPKELLATLERLEKPKGEPGHDKLNTTRFIMERIREQTWVLEPSEKLDPYRSIIGAGKTITELHKISDPAKLAERIDKFLRDGFKGQNRSEPNLEIFVESLEVAPRVGEAYVVRLLTQVAGALSASVGSEVAGVAERQRKLLQKALELAGHYGKTDVAANLFDLFIEVLRQRTRQNLRADASEVARNVQADVNEVARECLRSLRKLGLTPQIHRFLEQITALIVQGQRLDKLRAQAGKYWFELLRSLLALAEGWLSIGQFDQARLYLDCARQTLFEKEPAGNFVQYTKLVKAYISALGQAPVREAIDRVEALFVHMPNLPNTFLSKSHYSLLHLNIVGDVVRTMLSENFTMNDATRRRLEEDEYLVRRRIHADMKKYLSQGGL